MKKYKEWLTNEIEIMESETSENYPHEQMVEREVVLDLINQLDEPEVLSKEWVDSNSVNASHDGVTDEYVHVDDLQNLLVPKQELPVIPRFVADYLEKAKKEIDLLRVFEIANGLDELDMWRKEYNWIRLYHLDFAKAWLDGYTVEEEQKYYVDLGDVAYLAKWSGDNQVDFYTDSISGSDEFELHLTEQEIKRYDERFWAFAVKVEE